MLFQEIKQTFIFLKRLIFSLRTMIKNPRPGEEKMIKDISNLFRLKKELNYTAVKDLFRLEKETEAIKYLLKIN